MKRRIPFGVCFLIKRVFFKLNRNYVVLLFIFSRLPALALKPEFTCDHEGDDF